eukprot:284819251_2
MPPLREIYSGTWDDHDYGINDGDKTYPYKTQSKALFLDFLNVSANDSRRSPDRHGVYTVEYCTSTSPDGKSSVKIAVVLLDLRWALYLLVYRGFHVRPMDDRSPNRRFPGFPAMGVAGGPPEHRRCTCVCEQYSSPTREEVTRLIEGRQPALSRCKLRSIRRFSASVCEPHSVSQNCNILGWISCPEEVPQPHLIDSEEPCFSLWCVSGKQKKEPVVRSGDVH